MIPVAMQERLRQESRAFRRKKGYLVKIALERFFNDIDRARTVANLSEEKIRGI
jgi:predicted DNA-binding protein